MEGGSEGGHTHTHVPLFQALEASAVLVAVSKPRMSMLEIPFQPLTEPSSA